MALHLGISGFPGLDPNPFEHIKAYSRQHEGVGVGLGDLGHDAAAVLVEDGRVVFAVEEERLVRSKHVMGLPLRAVSACLEFAGASPGDVRFAYYLDPDDDHLRRRIAALAGTGAAAPAAVEREFRHARDLIAASVSTWPGIRPVDHHLAHAASAFYPSGFERALVLVIDGQGESTATSAMLGEGSELRPLARYPVTGSLGLLYAAITAYLGFEPIEDEYKIMGLAAYGDGGDDEYRGFFDRLIRASPDDGGFAMPELFEPAVQRLPRWSAALGWPRGPGDAIEPRHIAIAHSLQRALERTVMRLLEIAYEGALFCLGPESVVRIEE